MRSGRVGLAHGPAVPQARAAMSIRSFFLVHPKGLVVRREGSGVTLPNEGDVTALGAHVGEPHMIGGALGSEAVARSVAGEASLPEPLAVLGLRELFMSLGEDQFKLAGRATQIVEWATTH